MACMSLKLCASLEAGIEGTTHAVAQRWQERDTSEPKDRAAEVLEGAKDKRAAESGGTGKAGGEETLGWIGEVPPPPGERKN